MRQFQDFGQGQQGQGGYGGYGMGMPQMGMGMGMPPMGYNVSIECLLTVKHWDVADHMSAISIRLQPLCSTTSDVRSSNGISKRNDDVCCGLPSWWWSTIP